MGAATISLKQGTNKDNFYEGRTPKAKDLRFLSIGADLDSVGLRLWKLEQVLNKAWLEGGRTGINATIGWQDAEGYFGNDPNRFGKKFTGPVNLALKAPEWIHVMIRHNTCHDEKNKGGSSGVDARREDRRRCLANMRIREAFRYLSDLDDNLRQHLKTAGSMRLPPKPY